jgi:hypothetical protein
MSALSEDQLLWPVPSDYEVSDAITPVHIGDIAKAAGLVRRGPTILRLEQS